MDDVYRADPQKALSRRDFLHGAGAAVAGLALMALPLRPVISPAKLKWAAQGARALNVTDPAFGARGDGVANDRAAFQAAIDAAIARRLPLWVPKPSAFYRIDLDAANNQLRVHGDLTIVGAGRDTLLRFSIPTPDASKMYSGFFIHSGCAFQAAELRLEEDVHPTEFEIQAFNFESGSEDHVCLIERVDVDGFTNIVFSSSGGVGDGKGELFVAVRGCDFKPHLRYCVALWTVPEGHKRLHMYDCYLHDNQHSHLVYCHPHNSVHIENCRFDGATDWAFHFQGSAVAGDPEYQRFVGCWFGPRNGRGIITQDRAEVATTVEVRNCIFEGRPAVQIRSDIVIESCYFTASPDPANSQTFISAYSNSPWKAVIRNCIFAPKANALPQIDLRLDNIDVTVENCQFYNQGSGAIMSLGVGAANRYQITDCLFYNRPDNGAQATSLEIDNGQAVVRDCLFVGRSTGDRGAIILYSTETGPTADARLQLDNCTFQAISGGSVFFALTGANSWSGKVSGANNRFHRLQADKPLLMMEPVAPFFARLTPAAGQAPASLPAAPTLVINSNYDAFGVAGPGDVSTIHWWTEDGLSDALFSGAIALIGAAPFALVGGGNIVLAGGAARRDVGAGATVRLSYDPQQALWAEAG